MTHPLQSLPNAGPAYYQGRPAGQSVTALRRMPGQLVLNLTHRPQRLWERRLAGGRLEPMPRIRWYS